MFREIGTRFDDKYRVQRRTRGNGKKKLLKIETLGFCFRKLGLGSMTKMEYIGGQEEKVNKVIEN